jgi:multidrug efflux system outer membrane protein
LADLLSSQYARHAVMLTVVTNVATSYFQLLALDDQLRLARQTLKNRGAALNLIENRYKGGSSSRMAVLQARSAVDEVWVAIPELERQIAVLEDAISILVGRNPGTIIRHRDDEPALPPVPGGVPSDVLSRRPDVLAAEQQLVGANARIGIAKAALFPSISLTGMFGVASNALDTLTDGDATEASIGLGLLGPIFAGGRLKAGVREAEAYQQELLVKYRQTVLTALGNVDDALTFNVKANEIARRGEQQVATLNDRLHLSEVRYDGGQADYLEVLTAERDLYSAQAQQVDRHRDTYLALVSIYGAMGGGWMVEQDKLRAPDKQDTASAAQPRATSAGAGGKGASSAPAAAMPAAAPPTKAKSPESAQ